MTRTLFTFSSECSGFGGCGKSAFEASTRPFRQSDNLDSLHRHSRSSLRHGWCASAISEDMNEGICLIKDKLTSAPNFNPELL